jgi:hypothetical protein
VPLLLCLFPLSSALFLLLLALLLLLLVPLLLQLMPLLLLLLLPLLLLVQLHQGNPLRPDAHAPLPAALHGILLAAVILAASVW